MRLGLRLCLGSESEGNDPIVASGQLADDTGAATLAMSFGAAGMPIGWFAGDLSARTIVTGVSRWDDISGALNHLLQALTSKQPTVVASAVNGLTALRWDGVDDFMQFAVASNGNPQTVIAVMRQITQHTGGANDEIWDSKTGTHVFLSASDIAGIHSGSFITTGPLAITSYKVVTTKFGTSGAIRVAKTDILTGNSGTNAFNGFTLGSAGDGNRNTNIEVAELLIFDSNLGSGPLGIVEDYLTAKYGL